MRREGAAIDRHPVNGKHEKFKRHAASSKILWCLLD